MKKFLLFFSIILIFSNISFGQEKNLKIVKFLPFSLITGSLNVNQEIFSKEKHRSIVINLGVRNVNKESNATDYSGLQMESFTAYNKWRGGTVGVERRIYVPKFQSGSELKMLNEKGNFGLFFSVGTRLDYNVNSYDKSYYLSQESITKPGTYINVLKSNKGKTSYLGIMPNLNLGVQFTVFENLYVETFLGGGLRFLIEKEIDKPASNNAGYNNYNIETGIIESLVIKEGVKPNFGFGLGLKI